MTMRLQRLRAILTTAVLWAGAWILGCSFLVIPWLLGGRVPAGYSFLGILGTLVVLWGAAGMINGVAFAVFLMLAERNRSLEGLSGSRVALWGGIGAALFPAVLYLLFVTIPGFTLLGSGVEHAGIGGFLVTCLTNGVFGSVIAATHLSLARRLPAGVSRPQLTEGAAT